MVSGKISNGVILIFLPLYIILSIKITSGEADCLMKHDPAKGQSREEYSVGGHSNILDIRLTTNAENIESREVIREEIKSVLKDFKQGLINCTDRNTDEESPITVRATINDPQTNNLAEKLDNLATKIQATEEALKNLLGNIGSAATCLTEKKPLGVSYNRLNLKKQTYYYPKSCKELYQNGTNISGIYEIFPKHANKPFAVLCDMETKGGGWTHMQKRFDGSQDFGLKWRDYKFGFGDLDGEFWLGLQQIYWITGFDEPTELLVEIVDRDNITGYAQYQTFAISSEKEAYTLTKLSGYSGDANDALAHQLGQKFSTIDLDWSNACATEYLGGWWYKQCFWSNLNGKHLNIDLGQKHKYHGLQWDTWRYTGYCHSRSRMLLRPAN